jgi:hypothetical protein
MKEGDNMQSNLKMDNKGIVLDLKPYNIDVIGDLPNVERDARIDNQCWENQSYYGNNWTLQMNKYIKKFYRIVGPDGKVKARGNKSTMGEKMKRLARKEFLQPGDVLGVSRKLGLYEHYAIYIGNKEVIHFAGEDKEIAPQKAKICKADLSKFIDGDDDSWFVVYFGGKFPVKIMNQTEFVSNTSVDYFNIGAFRPKDINQKVYSDEETVERAKSRLGEKKYDLALNNCEHFAMWCKTGDKVSHQVNKRVRDVASFLKNALQYNKVGILLELIKELVPAVRILVYREYGRIKKKASVEINGVKGSLVWDYTETNNITFKDVNGNMYSFFSSASEDEAEDEWNRLMKKFASKNC